MGTVAWHLGDAHSPWVRTQAQGHPDRISHPTHGGLGASGPGH